jgi:hypothetical protein
MEEAPENGKALSRSAHANGMNKYHCHIIMWVPIITELVL